MAFDKFIEFSQPVTVKSASGMETTTFQKLDIPSYGELVTKPGGEKNEGKQLVASRQDTFRIRYRADINETFIMEVLGTKYDIYWIEPENRRAYIQITATRKDNDR
ncbi:hypothetical protein DN752_19620 [Echinicola strongylocentroti]|uniref:Head-tail adaptor protein n=1 Tax=Echinicola strongylocentroti TaxID=1795355 RepID=A0A2Z4IM22_9BACT|nr:head-tail adaptor protein [Echinicola strongylocentroti]AWW32171.1 hypothetical protein DN752_19620 [Echinicola strongylocentroti]